MTPWPCHFLWLRQMYLQHFMVLFLFMIRLTYDWLCGPLKQTIEDIIVCIKTQSKTSKVCLYCLASPTSPVPLCICNSVRASSLFTQAYRPLNSTGEPHKIIVRVTWVVLLRLLSLILKAISYKNDATFQF